MNGSYQATSNDFGDSGTFVEHAENGHVDSQYSVGTSRGLNIAGGVMITSRVGVGVGISRFSRGTPGRLTASIPHPFFFNTPRSISGDIDELHREELAVHLQLRVVRPIGTRVEVAVFGGPSLIRLEQDVVTDFAYEESYPYDEARFGSTERTLFRKSGMGFNGGGDLAFFLTRRVGIGLTAMYARAAFQLPITEDRTADLETGGVQVGAGLRFRF